MPVVAADEDGSVLDVLVHGRRGRHLARERPVVVPVAADEPAIARRLLVELHEPAAELGLVLGVLEVDPRQLLAAAQEVRVGVVEPRHDAPAGEVDHLCLGTDELPDLLIRPDLEYPPAPHGDALGLGPGGVNGPDLAVDEHSVGRDDRFSG